MRQTDGEQRSGRGVTFFLVIALSFACIGGGVAVLASRFFSATPALLPGPPPSPGISIGTGIPIYNPPPLEAAPSDIRDAVRLGYNILMETRNYTPDYVGNNLSCRNCHFKAGLTEGGSRGGLSLVGVAVIYPKYRERQHAAVDLTRRTNDCFERSMNGKPLPQDSKEMTAILTYFQWIAKGLPIYTSPPWLGLKRIKAGHEPDAAAGKKVFRDRCAVCHGDEGQGTDIAPPLWGPKSFNSGAGMARAETMAAFTRLNMPNGNPDVPETEALDVSAFVTKQPRPKFVKR
jgi:thiosulfate dehydrogenase